jgi:hypothetical protein
MTAVKMYNWDYIEQEISKIVLKHTTKITLENVGEFTTAIIDAWLNGISFEHILANEKPADEDAENLIKAAAQIDLAIKSIEKLGYLGTLALKKLTPDDLRKSLAPMSEQLNAAAKQLDKSDRGMISILSGDNKNPPKELGRKRNLAALYITRQCAHVFEVGTNNKASLTRSAHDENPLSGGKFYKFLTEVFELLEINANIEYCIKLLKSEKKAK